MYLFDSKKQSTNIRIKDGKEIPFKSTKTFHHFKYHSHPILKLLMLLFKMNTN